MDKKKKKKAGLKDIFPQEPTFFLKAKKKHYRVRIFGLADQIWLGNTFGTKVRVAEVMLTRDWLQISKIAFFMLHDEDKGDFAAVERETFDDQGVKVMRLFTGPENLLLALQNSAEADKMLEALNESGKISNPEAFVEAEKVVEDLKKKMLQKETTKGAEPTGAA